VAQTRQRIAQYWRIAFLCQSHKPRRIDLGLGTRTTDDHATAARKHPADFSDRPSVRRRFGTSDTGRPVIGTGSTGRMVQTGRDQRLPKRGVDMNRPGMRPEREVGRPDPYAIRVGKILSLPARRCERKMGAHAPTEHGYLIGGLIRTAILQFRRPIRTDKNERYVVFVRFDERRVPVCGCGPGCRNDDDRSSGRSRDAERKKGGRTLIYQDSARNFFVTQTGQCERRRPRAGRNHCIAHATFNQTRYQRPRLAQSHRTLIFTQLRAPHAAR